jgi:hypothetical protein
MKTILFVFTIALLPFSHAQASTPPAPIYGFATDYLTTEDQTSAYYTGVAALVNSFNEVCGDTFCEGEYSNLASLDFTCSIKIKDRSLTECLWSFVGTVPHVNATTGKVTETNRKIFTCKIDVAGIKLDDFVQALVAKNQSAFYDAPFVNKKAIYDQLTHCL